MAARPSGRRSPLPSCRAVFSRRFHHSLPQPHCDSPVLDSWTHREARPPEENAQHGPPGPPGLTRTQSEMLRHLSAALAFPSVFTLKIISSAFLAFPRSPGAGSAPVLSVYFHFSFFPLLGRPGTVRSLYDWVTLHISPHNVALEHEARKSQARSAYPGRGFSTGSAARRIQSILKAESRPGARREAPRPVGRQAPRREQLPRGSEPPGRARCRAGCRRRPRGDPHISAGSLNNGFPGRPLPSALLKSVLPDAARGICA